MPKETEYYDTLGVSPTATDNEIKRAYRKMAIKTHPDKNPDDPQAQEKFQAVSEAYQVLIDHDLRARYDELGKDGAKPAEGFEDPVALATSIFGGGAFASYIGEISIMKEMAQLGELEEEEEEEVNKAKAETAASAASSSGASGNTSATPPDAGPTAATPDSKIRLLHLHDGQSTEHHHGHHFHLGPNRTKSGANSATISSTLAEKEAKNAAKQKRKAALEKLDKENRETRERRIDELTKILVEKLSVYTETSKSAEFANNYVAKLEEEANNLKMESFGLDLLHVIGTVYYTRASLFLKSQKMFGFGGMFGKIKEAGTMVRDVFDAVSATMEAQSYVQTASEIEGTVTAEQQVELEQIIFGKMLGALWIGSRFEIQGILRVVCDKVLHDKAVPLAKRVERAHGLKIMGQVFKTTERSKEEAEEMQFFEGLVAAANAKKAKKLRKDFASGAAAAAAQAQARADAANQMPTEAAH